MLFPEAVLSTPGETSPMGFMQGGHRRRSLGGSWGGGVLDVRFSWDREEMKLGDG